MNEEVETVDGARLMIDRDGVQANHIQTEAIDSQQIERCVRWFRQVTIETPPAINSHWLRHVVQNQLDEKVSIGALIVAAYRCGIPIAHNPESDRNNVTIGISADNINEYDCGCAG
ncbi:MAG: hypothetical protein AB8B91_00610 [Rubripirellula sp.]